MNTIYQKLESAGVFSEYPRQPMDSLSVFICVHLWLIILNGSFWGGLVRLN